MDTQDLLQIEEAMEVVDSRDEDDWDEDDWDAYRDEWEVEHGRCFDCGREPKECICDPSE